MGLMNELGLAPGSVNIDDVQKQMAAGGLVPEGVHHAVLETAGAIPNADGRGWRLTFKVIAGAGDGGTVEEALWKPKGDDEKKDAKTRNRVLMFGHRLGLVKRDKDGKLVEVEGKHDFCDCLGAPCFIEVKHEDEEWEKDGKKRSIKKAKLTFEGVLSPDDKRVKDVPKAKNIPVPSAVGQPAGAGAAGAKKDDYSDL